MASYAALQGRTAIVTHILKAKISASIMIHSLLSSSLLFFRVTLILYLVIAIINVYRSVYVLHLCRGQRTIFRSRFSFHYGFQGANSSCQACVASTFNQLNHVAGPTFFFLLFFFFKCFFSLV